MSPTEDQRISQLVGLAEKQRDALDKHARDMNERWDDHVKEHRTHDKEHSEIGQWQVKTEGRLREGSETLAELRVRTKPFSSTSLILWTIGFLSVFGGAIWSLSHTIDTKADFEQLDKVSAAVNLKADKYDTQQLALKIETLTNTLNNLVNKIEKK